MICKVIFTLLESFAPGLSTGICIILKILQNLAILAKYAFARRKQASITILLSGRT